METTTATAEGTQASAEEQPGVTGQQQTNQPGQAAAADFAWDGKVESLPEPVQKLIRDARAEAGKARTTAKQTAAEEARQELAQQIGRAIGLIKDDDGQVDPAKVTEQITAERAGKHEALVKLALYETAKHHGGNPAALKDSVSFLSKVAKLDSTADDFPAQVAAAAKEAVEANPTLKAVQVAGRSGGEFTGGPGGDAVTPDQFQRMSVAQRQELFQRDPTLYRKLAGR